MPSPVLAALLVLAVAGVQAGEKTCLITQKCIPRIFGPPNTCTPVIDVREPYSTGMPVDEHPCPQYAEKGCCSLDQLETLKSNFLTIDFSFAHISNGGCPGCAQNLKNLWCTYTCGTDQNYWLSAGNVTTVHVSPTPGEPKVPYKVLPTYANINKDYACSMFQSCQSTTYVRLGTQISTCEAFLSFMGFIEASPRGIDITFNFTDDPRALHAKVLPCCNWDGGLNPEKPTPGKNQSCPCSSCQKACAHDPGCTAAKEVHVDPLNVGVFNGCDWFAVGIVYGGIALLSIVIVGYTHIRRRTPDKKEDLAPLLSTSRTVTSGV